MHIRIKLKTLSDKSMSRTWSFSEDFVAFWPCCSHWVVVKLGGDLMSPEGPLMGQLPDGRSSLQAAVLYLLPFLTPCQYREVFLSLLNHGHLCFNGSVSQISLQIPLFFFLMGSLVFRRLCETVAMCYFWFSIIELELTHNVHWLQVSHSVIALSLRGLLCSPDVQLPPPRPASVGTECWPCTLHSAPCAVPCVDAMFAS